MNFLSKEKGSVNLAVLIVVAIVIICLLVYGIILVNSNQVTNTNIATGNQEGNPEEIVEKEPDEPIEKIDYNSDDFSYEFLKLESDLKKDENIIYSPLSIKYGLNLLLEGAEGDTKKEIKNILGDAKLTKYKNINKVLSFANGVYIKNDYKDGILDSYTDVLKDNYDAEVMYDNFESAKNINKWVSNKTFGVINNFFKDKDIAGNQNLVMILLNALAIDMKWEADFETDDTNLGIFDKDGNNLEVAFMKKENVYEDSISYKVDEDVTVLAMDLKEYGGVTLEFDAIMPNEETLSDFISNIDNKKIDNYLSDLTNASSVEGDVNIRIPKFDFDYSISLKNELKAMGMEKAFDYSADFSKITGDTSLFVSEALHKADIKFSEEGIRAAAVTAFEMAFKSARPSDEIININIDKPFMFVIRDKENGEVWFVGSVYNPVLWDDVKAEYGR